MAAYARRQSCPRVCTCTCVMAKSSSKVKAVRELSHSSVRETGERPFPSLRARNKVRRLVAWQKEKARRLREKRERRERRKKEREQLGDEAPPPQVPRTLENTRVPDETTVLPDDEEVLQDEQTDELSSYFDRKTTPTVLILSAIHPHLQTNLLLRELNSCIPNSEVRRRRRAKLKKTVSEATERGFTDIIVVNEDRKMPNGLVLVHLPEGPTAHFKLSSFRRGYSIKNHGRPTDHKPEVILNNFSTRLGHTVGRMLAALFPHDPEFKGRQAVTFHNQRDYIFFRRHRYIFRSAQRVGIQEIGPRFTLKLRSLQKGTFDTKHGEYIWLHNRKQMDTSRRKFHL